VTDREAAPPSGTAPRALSRWLNIGGAVIVAVLMARDPFTSHPLWVWVLTGVALLAWLARVSLPRSGGSGVFSLVVILVAIVASSLVAVPTEVLGMVPALVSGALLVASPSRPLALGLGMTAGSAVLVALSTLTFHRESGAIVGAFAALAVTTLVGLSRRQYRTAAVSEHELLQERLRLSDEREHAAALTERSRIARDIHDVLAHSLGGLVLQLDAIDALLDSVQVAEAHRRVVSARELAASGLEEARRAVDALRDPELSADLAGTIEALLVTHRSLGSEASLQVNGSPVSLSTDAAGAMRRAAQELLSNARRHAPGQATTLKLSWLADAATLTGTTPLEPGVPPSSAGSGRGLAGLRERMVALGGIADWAICDGAFHVTARIPLCPAVAS
jgi:signal transduction histidine kinase